MNVGYNPHLGYEADVLRDYKKAVYSIANKYRGCLNSGIDYEDLISIGTIGLIEAFRNYDPGRFNGKVTSFSTYAFPMIKWSIQRFLRDKRYSVRVPRSIQSKLTMVRKRGWEQETPEDIVKMSGWKLSEVLEVKQHLDGWTITSLDQAVTTSDKNDDSLTLLDLMPSTADFSGADVQEFISCLEPVEKTVLRLRIEGLSQSDIAKQVGVSQVQISRRLSQIGTKYLQFQNGDLEKGEAKMSKPQDKAAAFVNSIEWFVDEAAPTNPTISLNNQGVHFNRRAVHEIGCKAGQCVQIGYDSAENRILIRVGTNGIQLRKVSGDTTGALRLVNKRLAAWLQQKELPFKRYVLHADQNAGIHYILLDRHA